MAKWYEADLTILDFFQRVGTLSIYFDYDLRSWLFGVSFDPDPCWHDLRISLGPIGLAFTYWRKPVCLLREETRGK